MKMEAQGFRVASKTTVSSRSKSRDKVKLPSSSTEEDEDYFIKRRFNGVRRSRSAKNSEKPRQRSPSAAKKPFDIPSLSLDKENQGRTRSKSKASDRSRSPQSEPANVGRAPSSRTDKASDKSKQLPKSKEDVMKVLTMDTADGESLDNQKNKEYNQEARPSRRSARSDGSKNSKGCVFSLIKF